MNHLSSALTVLMVTAALTWVGCKEEPIIDTNEITQPYYFQAVLDGDTVTYQEDINGYGNIVGDFFGGEVVNGWEYAPFTCLAGEKAVSSASPTPTDLASSGAVAIVALTSNQITNAQAYAALIQTGSLPIGVLSRSPGLAATPGAYISVFDENGVEWNTNNGVQDSTASLFVTEYYSSQDNDRFPPTRQMFAAEFNCKVYNAAGGVKTLTGGKVRGRLVIFQ